MGCTQGGMAGVYQDGWYQAMTDQAMTDQALTDMIDLAMPLGPCRALLHMIP